ncbi:MAG: HPr family phosphocarrier protein [Aestuariivita sp.]|nr:HPr family phosphocarrier protein [Aestuariivita sp.]
MEFQEEKIKSVKRVFEIQNEKGLHARASAMFVEVVERFNATVEVSNDGLSVPGDSIMGLLMLAASKGTSLNVVIEGSDAEELAKAIENLLNSKFGEGS